MVKHTWQWKWSSHRAMTGNDPASSWLETGWVLGQFGAQQARQIERYVEFVQQGVRGPAVWKQLKGQVYLGTDEFVAAMNKKLQADVKFATQEIPRAQRRALAKSLAYYVEELRDAKLGMAADATGDYTLQAIADAFRVHYSTVSRAMNGK